MSDEGKGGEAYAAQGGDCVLPVTLLVPCPKPLEFIHCCGESEAASRLKPISCCWQGQIDHWWRHADEEGRAKSPSTAARFAHLAFAENGNEDGLRTGMIVTGRSGEWVVPYMPRA
jgi:hypothetical protein